MALISAKLDADFEVSLERFGKKVSEPVLFSGAAAMARVIYDEVKINVSGIKPGFPGVVTGNLLNSIYQVKANDLMTPTRKVYEVSWNRSKAPHGHLIEFGTSRAPAYPFVRPAVGRMPEAIKAGLARMKVRFSEVTRGGS